MSERTLPAELRSEFGKGAARKARVAAKIPAVIYGHGADPIHVLLPAKSTTLALRQSNALLTLDVNGEQHLALAREIQRNSLKQIIEHVDFLTVRSGEKVTVDVYIHVEGELAPGAVMNLEHNTVSVEAEATHLPESLTVDVDGRTVGEHIYASDIVLPKGTTLLIEDDTLIVNISEPTVQDLGEDEEVTEDDASETSEEEPSEEDN